MNRFTTFLNRAYVGTHVKLGLIPSYVDGIDVSVWQGTIDWSVPPTKNVKFAYIRAGIGLKLDDQFARNAVEAPKHMKHLGFYWFFSPYLDPVAQATMFADAIRDKTWDLPPVVDVEVGSDGTNLRKFIKALKDSLNIKYVMIYTRESLWDVYYPADPVFCMMPLWAARYKSTLTGPWSDGYYKFRDWDDWDVWQWTSALNGYSYGMQSAGLDGDRFNGDEAAFEAWIKQYGKVAPVPDTWGWQVTQSLRSLGFGVKDPPDGI